ncbi:MAG: NmrA family NAD(P)-binding protein [Dyadobacter sp.]|uniref:NmrA family NAD(P)-binding protein n=1 Tax=Dyadobacter sp. TaxID=1914288 RepID=UPI001B2F6590|nr:NmrA family NAD(P)-binding protein [Dyadobacter sp.]MBO9611295.1 NmrA family NAD(P)-binding protein [Dyadobacter sp.]
MIVTVTGSLGNVGRILTEKLITKGHTVKVVTSNPARSEAIRALGAVPLVGSLDDYEFVKHSFEGSDAVYLMIPPDYHAPDVKQYMMTMGRQYARALKETGVKLAVNLSSVGAHLEDGLGPTGPNFYIEQLLNELQHVHVLHLRPGMFMTNFYGAMPLIRYQGMIGNNFNGSASLPLTHPRDIAEAAFRAIDDFSVSGKQVRYVVSDVKNGEQVARALGNAAGKPDVHWVEFSDEQLLGALMQDGFSQPMAQVYIIEIGVAIRDGSFAEDFQKQWNQPTGRVTLDEFSREFAMAYRSGDLNTAPTTF